jgi:hypothetical protein
MTRRTEKIILFFFAFLLVIGVYSCNNKEENRVAENKSPDAEQKFHELFKQDSKYAEICAQLKQGRLKIKEVRQMYVTCYTWNTNTDGEGRFGTYKTSTGRDASVGKNTTAEPRTFASCWDEVSSGTQLYSQDLGYGVIADRCGASEKDFNAGKMTRIDAFIGKYPTLKEAEKEESKRTGIKWVVLFQ